MKLFTAHLDQNLMIKMINIKKNNNNTDSKPLNIFNFLKSLSQEAEDLMDEKKDAHDDIYDDKLLLIGSNKEKFNFNTFNKPLNFISGIYNGKISLKEAEIKQRDLEKKIEELKSNYKPKHEKEKEEINGVLMQTNALFEYRDKVIDVFKDGTFLSEYF